MSRTLMLAAAAAISIGGSAVAASHKETTPVFIAKAVSDPARPAADTARDANRKPAALVAFAGVKPGDKVADFIPGGGYFTRILAKSVGPKGKVYAVTNPPAATATTPPAVFGIAADPAYGNIQVVATGIGSFKLPEQVDVFWTAQNYHDLHARSRNLDVAAVNKTIFAAIKPGGVFLVSDHAAAPGTAIDPEDKLHRIDPAIVKREVQAAGFKYEGESKVLANAGDDHTKAVFDASIRGKTDQFVYKFRKPR